MILSVRNMILGHKMIIIILSCSMIMSFIRLTLTKLYFRMFKVSLHRYYIRKFRLKLIKLQFPLFYRNPNKMKRIVYQVHFSYFFVTLRSKKSLTFVIFRPKLSKSYKRTVFFLCNLQPCIVQLIE